MADRVGTRVGNYRLERLLGKGGFAEVYLGVQVYLGTQAAVKLLHAPLASEPEIEQFRQEAHIIARLDHPQIVRVLDFGLEGDLPYLLLDYAPGGSLRQLHPANTQVPLARVVAYVQQIAQALQYAHDQHVIHRDLKPENLLLGRAGEVLLSDFGMSVVAESTSRQQVQGFAGTVAYCAPEQVQEHPRPASDQYALGVVVYEWLTGTRPFTGSFPEVAAKHLFVPPPPLRERLPALSAAVERVVLTALAKDPEARFASVSTFVRALEQASQVTLPAVETEPEPTPLPATPVPPAPAAPPTVPGGQQSAPPVRSLWGQEAPPPTPDTSAAAQTTPPPMFSPPALPPTERTLPLPQVDSFPPIPTAGEPAWEDSWHPPVTPIVSPRTSAPSEIPPARSRELLRAALLAVVLVLVLLGGGLGVLLTKRPASPSSTTTVTPTATAITTTATATPAGWAITAFRLPTTGYPALGITAGPDGNLWFIEGDGNRIGRITPRGAITEFGAPGAPSGYTGTGGITLGPDGNLWFTEFLGSKIGRITPEGIITEFPLPSSGTGVQSLNEPTGQEGTGHGGEVAGHVCFQRCAPPCGSCLKQESSPGDGRVPSPLCSNGLPGRMGANDLERSAWLALALYSGPGPGPGAITAGPDGNLWFTEEGQIGRITPRGTITEFSVPMANSDYYLSTAGITAGPDGNLWFTERGVNQIGRITPEGSITEFPAPTAAGNDPWGITAGPDGNLWFTDENTIGRITTGP